MKTLLAIIAAASLVVGCGVFEEEQTSIDATSGGTTSAPSGGGDSTPTVSADSAVTDISSDNNTLGKLSCPLRGSCCLYFPYLK